MRYIANTLCLLSIAAFALAADSPFAGKWKMNMAKSQFGGTTTTFEQTAPGEMQMTAEGQSYKFKIDGKEYPAIYGTTAVWKQIDPTTWETTYTLNGKVFSVNTSKISADGKTMTVVSKREMGGKTADTTLAAERVSGGPGLVGKWKTSNVKSDSPESMELVSAGDRFIFKFPDMQASCDAAFDSKDYICTGGMMPAGFSIALRKTGDRTFDITEKMKSKVVYTGSYTLSPDSKMLSLVAMPAGTSEKVKIVYDRE